MELLEVADFPLGVDVHGHWADKGSSGAADQMLGGELERGADATLGVFGNRRCAFWCFASLDNNRLVADLVVQLLHGELAADARRGRAGKASHVHAKEGDEAAQFAVADFLVCGAVAFENGVDTMPERLSEKAIGRAAIEREGDRADAREVFLHNSVADVS